ncbi:MAG: hypothetical protein WC683_03010 [bacterium]
MSEKHVKIVRAVRDQLKAYGVNKDESLRDAIDRLTAEHALATDEARTYKRLTEEAQQEAALARKTRDEAEATAIVALAKERAATFQNRALRAFLDLVIERSGAQIQKDYAGALAEIDARSKTIAKEAGTTRLEDDIREVEARRVTAFAQSMQGKSFDTYGNPLPNGVLCRKRDSYLDDCLAPNPKHPGANCHRPKTHGGQHQNGDDVWGDEPESRKAGA